MRYFTRFIYIILALGPALGAKIAHAETPPPAPVPGLEFLRLPANPTIGQILTSLYERGVILIVIASFIMLTLGGVQYMMAGDKDPTQAKVKMQGAIYGLILALVSFIILNTINPALVSISALSNLPGLQDVHLQGTAPKGAACDNTGFPSKTCGDGLTCGTLDPDPLKCSPSTDGTGTCIENTKICSA
ncbi:MAG: hypothetical protein HY221_02690 [Candidatus Sungbacteria bacterium]|uniref:Uncharacterized protein n=1 Tax=Candidatus Sungiibacteriota bacterium TaxID=2750080 RepID=A0A932R245_9BACT|nr:hypothetical protein [Candidatus Sungbacteria bacterium]